MVNGGVFLAALALAVLIGGCFGALTVSGGDAHLVRVQIVDDPDYVADFSESEASPFPGEAEIVVLKLYRVDDFYGDRWEWVGIDVLTTDGGPLHYPERLDLAPCTIYFGCNSDTRRHAAIGFVDGYWPRFAYEGCCASGDGAPDRPIPMIFHPRTLAYTPEIAHGFGLRGAFCLLPQREDTSFPAFLFDRMGEIARRVRTSDRLTTEQKRFALSQLLDVLTQERAAFDEVPRTVGEAAEACDVTVDDLRAPFLSQPSDEPDEVSAKRPYLVDLEAWIARCDKAIVALEEAIVKMDGE
jgi:hypothetical protein